MYEFVSIIIGSIAVTLINLYIWSKLLDRKINFKSFRTYLIIIGLVIFMTFNYYYVNNFFKIIFMTFIMIAFCGLLFRENLNKIIVTPIVSQFIIMISELIFLFLAFIVVGSDLNYKINDYLGTLLINFSVAILAFILIKLHLGYRLYSFLVKITSKINNYELVIFLIILVISVNILEVSIYNKIDIMWLALINTSLILIYAIIIFKMANTRNQYLTISDKYNNSKSSLIEYQTVVNRYRIDNHENKNQLKILRGKIDINNKDALEYIDTILDTRIKSNEKVLNKTKVIPNSSLRTLIDSKIMIMEEKEINNILHVDKKIKTVYFIDMNPTLMEDICKIIGVYLDNAIEEVENLSIKEVQIDIYEIDNFIYITVSNNFEGYVELDKINEVGYTTKINGHGYGLPLANELIEANEKLFNDTYINNGIFKQVLKIKI